MIVYTVICRSKDAAVLVEVSNEAMQGNAPQVTTALLEHLRDNPKIIQEGELKTYIHRNGDDDLPDDIFGQMIHACTIPITSAEHLELGEVQEHYFHLWFQDGVFYCCLSDDPEPKHHKVAFAFLQAVARDFTRKYSSRKIKNVNAYALDKEFSSNVRNAMHYYNINCEKLSRDPQVNALLAQIDDMRAVLGRNINLLLERGDKIDSIMTKSEKAKRDTLVFKRKSEKMKKYKKIKNLQMNMILGGVIVILIIILSFFLGKNNGGQN